MLNESFHLPWDVKGHWEPAWRSIHTTTYDYVEWRADGRIIGREYYDLTQDPDELTNLLRDGDPTNNPDTHTAPRPNPPTRHLRRSRMPLTSRFCQGQSHKSVGQNCCFCLYSSDGPVHSNGPARLLPVLSQLLGSEP